VLEVSTKCRALVVDSFCQSARTQEQDQNCNDKDIFDRQFIPPQNVRPSDYLRLVCTTTGITPHSLQTSLKLDLFKLAFKYGVGDCNY
jgi:hypothetical protein